MCVRKLEIERRDRKKEKNSYFCVFVNVYYRKKEIQLERLRERYRCTQIMIHKLGDRQRELKKILAKKYKFIGEGQI